MKSADTKNTTVKFIDFSIMDGRMIINASSGDDSELFRQMMEALGARLEIKYDGICG